LKILITGASGYLGSHLSKKLVADGHTVILLLRETSSLARLSSFSNDCLIERYSNLSQIYNIIERINPEIVIHAACLYGRNEESIHDLLEANLLFGIKIIEAIIKLNLSIKFINTDTCLPKNLNRYALSKAQFAEWGRSLAMNDTSITFINVFLQTVYGPGDDLSKLPSYIVHSCCENVVELKLSAGLQLRDFIYIDDVTSAYLLLIKNICNFESFVEIPLGTGESVSVKEFVETARRLTSSSTNLLFGAMPTRKNEPKECVADIKLMCSLGWAPKFSLVEGLKEMIRCELNMVKK